MQIAKKFLDITFSRNKLLDTSQILAGSLFLSLCAQIKIPLPFTPIPFTMQTLAVLLLGVTLKERGCIAIFLYLIQGSLGAPVWSGSGSGIERIIGPSGGYLLSYPLQAYLIAKWTQKERGALSLFLVLLSSISLQLSIGSLWLGFFIGMKKCFELGFIPFILGDALKAFLVTISFSKKNK